MAVLYENVTVLQTLNKHTSDVTCCDFAPNFTLITGSSDKTIRLWEWIQGSGYIEKSFSPLRDHKYGVTCVKVSPQGLMLASTSIDGTAVLWNLQAGTKIHTLVQINGDAIKVCRFSPDSSILVTAGDNGAICVWDLVHRSLLRTSFLHEGITQSLSFTRDSLYLVSACSMEVIRVWNVQDLIDTANDGPCTSVAVVDNAHDLGILCLDVSNVITPDDHDPLTVYYTLATSGNCHDIKVWTITSRITPKHKNSSNRVSVEHTGAFHGHKSAVTCIKYNSNGMYLISSSLDKLVKIWDSNGACVCTLSAHTRYINCVSFSRDNGLIASGSNDRSVIIWDLSGHLHLNSELIKPYSVISNGVISNGLHETRVVENAENCDNNCELIKKIVDISEASINSCNFYGNDLLVTGSSDKLVRVFSVEEDYNVKEKSFSPIKSHTFAVNHVEFSKDGTMLATCSLDGCTMIWDAVTGVKKIEMPRNKLGVRDCRFSFDGSYLVTVGDDEKADVWNVKNAKIVLSLEGHSETVTSACFSPDGNIICTTSNNEDFRIWTLTGNCVYVEDDAHDLGIQNCDFSENLEPIPYLTTNDEQHYLLTTCGNDSLVKLWRISISKEKGNLQFDGTEVKLWRTLQGHGSSVICVRFSHGAGEIVCSTSSDRQARVWSVYSGECLHVLDHDSIVMACSFTADCSLLATACLDKSLRLWKLPQQLVLRTNFVHKIKYRKRSLIDWSTGDVLQWLKDIGFSEISTNAENTSLDGQKILTLPEDRLCSGLDLDNQQTKKLLQELKWLKREELHSNILENPNTDIPNEYLCPITQEIMREPVTCSDGFTYEKQAISEWFLSGRYTSPMTNEPLSNTVYQLNQELRNAIRNFLYERESRPPLQH